MMRSDAVILWMARILGIAMCLFLALFALDAREPGTGVAETLVGVAIHLLPSTLVLAIVIVSWHREWIGGVAFVGLAAAYAVTASFRMDWVLVISGPLLLIGLLYLWGLALRLA